MTLKVISFDLDDTFWPILPVVLRAEKLTNLWLIKNYPCIEPLLKKEEIIPIRDELIYKNASLSHQLSKLRSMIVSELAMRAGYDASESKEIASKSFEIFFEARNEVVLFEGVKESLENLKSNYSLGVITNGNADLKKIGLSYLFDFVVSAEDISASKPDPEIFNAAIEKSGSKADEICHVGDHPINDIQGSLNVGMRAIWFNKRRQEWPLSDIKVNEINSWLELEYSLKQIT